MLEKALTGSRRYWAWLTLLAVIIGVGFVFYLRQLDYGLGITGMGRDVSWGLYIANLTFFVGVAASAVMLVLPYYLHNYKAFGRITALGEFLAVAAVIVAGTSVTVDLGQPARIFNLILHPAPNSPLFWDVIVLSVYMLLNLVIGWTVLDAERKGERPPAWIKPLILLSIPWAVSIHTVTAFIYSGLAARPLWLTALLAPRFLSSAFASGPALLIILGLIIKRVTRFDPGEVALQMLAKIVTYALIITLFFLLVEIFTVFYSQIPEHMSHFQYLFFGLNGKANLVPWMWTSIILALVAVALLLNGATRRKEGLLAIACVAVFISMWIDKGLGLIIPGFIPSQTGVVFQYLPTLPEVLISVGVCALGALVLTVLYKIAISVSEEIAD
ncbi:sulfate reduction electron transfer complex DsrMKJOP subunit DsrP [Chloroflexota bacterium]